MLFLLNMKGRGFMSILFNNGSYYLVSSGPVTLPGNSFLGIELHNPSGSNKQVLITQMINGAIPSTSFTLIRNGSFAGGTPLTPYNADFGSSKTSSATVKVLSLPSDPFAGAPPLSTVLQSSGSIDLDFNDQIVLPPSSSLGIRIANNLPQPSLMAVTIGWREQKESIWKIF
jgi:hypothetical protein